jgi:hypothetical protein
MQRGRRSFRELWMYTLVGFALITASACNSSPASSGSLEGRATAASEPV